MLPVVGGYRQTGTGLDADQRLSCPRGADGSHGLLGLPVGNTEQGLCWNGEQVSGCEDRATINAKFSLRKLETALYAVTRTT